ncbi:MAG TPA: DUF4118 domain-containing protein, partial [Candidatus Eisenbacteria bacterium]|nr:DUF4118 domain-containing protein [Candidatus Eisenbacteria bacterium]
MKPFVRRLPAYGVAVLTTAVMGWIRWMLAPVLGGTAVFIPFIIPVIFAGAVGGMGPGLVATALGILTVTYFFLPPFQTLELIRTGHVVGLVIYAVCGVALSVAAGALRASRGRIQRKHGELLAALSQRDEAARQAVMVSQALHAAELQHRTITDAVPALVSFIDQERRYRLVNHTYETWLGVPREEIVSGLTTYPGLPHRQERV